MVDTSRKSGKKIIVFGSWIMKKCVLVFGMFLTLTKLELWGFWRSASGLFGICNIWVFWKDASNLKRIKPFWTSSRNFSIMAEDYLGNTPLALSCCGLVLRRYCYIGGKWKNASSSFKICNFGCFGRMLVFWQNSTFLDELSEHLA